MRRRLTSVCPSPKITDLLILFFLTLTSLSPARGDASSLHEHSTVGKSSITEASTVGKSSNTEASTVGKSSNTEASTVGKSSMAFETASLRPSRHRETRFSQVYGENGPREGDFALFISQHALRSQVAQELASPHLNERIENLDLCCLDGKIRLSGAYDGPLCFDPSVSAEISLAVVDGQTVDLHFGRIKVVGVALKLFSKVVCNLVEKALGEHGKDMVSVAPLGKNEVGAYGLRLTVHTKAILPMVRSEILLHDLVLSPDGLEIRTPPTLSPDECVLNRPAVV